MSPACSSLSTGNSNGWRVEGGGQHVLQGPVGLLTGPLALWPTAHAVTLCTWEPPPLLMFYPSAFVSLTCSTLVCLLFSRQHKTGQSCSLPVKLA
ncbi:hypothetical protein EYF80_056588 [Liparis tanakae]|uniref:Uncharacterized protein n=1 Tax=Liparis tanakae TaxID=230148 RepID=A0A4Z2EWR9_9TELE|nr:hypothetical protein EYF80_056588 [Liparis tanakae]